MSYPSSKQQVNGRTGNNVISEVPVNWISMLPPHRLALAGGNMKSQ